MRHKHQTAQYGHGVEEGPSGLHILTGWMLFPLADSQALTIKTLLLPTGIPDFMAPAQTCRWTEAPDRRVFTASLKRSHRAVSLVPPQTAGD